jgi:mannose/cellobiose epimerase-like protein (N-acyl-D-glucosamine 2-epimerase family)/anti-anti-sigma regulatory factor
MSSTETRVTHGVATTFPFSDTIAGYIRSFDSDRDVFTIEAPDGRVFEAKLRDTTYAEVIRNLGEAYVDATASLRDMLIEGRYLFAYGVFYGEADVPFEVEHVLFLGRDEHEYVFERPAWWTHQVGELARFYLDSQFGTGPIDFSRYTTMLDLYGHKMDSARQETDTISRLVYGFASAYLLTGDDRCLEAAEKGTEYLRTHFRALDEGEQTAYWYHAVDFSDKGGRRILNSNMPEIPGMRRTRAKSVRENQMISSEFGDDFGAIPAYEQIYALAGPTQTYRITGDPLIRRDIDYTVNFLNRYFRDYDRGGYWSHVDPVTFSGVAAGLGSNRARKNWNSVGDHAPAYLINLVLATGEQQYVDMLIETADTITERFADYEHSPFVQEKFHADWSHDSTWGWQQNRAVVGHNLKIAWNLIRINCLHPDERYVQFAERIAELMPQHGMDRQRGGWYDVVDRAVPEGQTARVAFHDRKAWWQQEQGILAYLILAGCLGKKEYRKRARESSAFYNTFFLDHEAGGVYFNTLASGVPFLVGTERNKGSHSMSGYHSFELCYLATVYTNLLITKQPLMLHFKPKPGAFAGNVLRVAPDLLPPGSVKIDSVTVDGQPYTEFDAEALTVQIPPGNEPVAIKVRLVPTSGLAHFSSELEVKGREAVVKLDGDLDASALPFMRRTLEDILVAAPAKVTIDCSDLHAMSAAGARALIYGRQRLGMDDKLMVTGANASVTGLLSQDEFINSIEVTSSPS